MAARRTELVKQPESPLVPGLREDPVLEPELLDDSTQQLRLSPEDILAEPPDARDIAAELAAPPRRKLPWLTLLLAAGVIAAGSFAGGALVEKNSGSGSSGAASAFAKLRSGAAGAADAGGFTRGGASGSASGGFGGGFGGAGGATTGTVKLVDGSTIYVTNSSGNIVKVTTGGSTTVSIAKSGTVSQLQPGQTVTVRGTTDSSGNVAATSVSEGGTTGAAGAAAGGSAG
ncbi:hypothetical protein GXW83_00410 [Streptacidiphilus sp. PB12-B1b]|uniref:hypothetical protein n=1 Tax=Streptacidiphilus sp. PB12-B1b TaxID=2705012 RepID=UPI0015FB6B65|nr:hypothetical protein [Streptacidiphilus sp. PB12-B1b]QMU74480.1 hypothetical protein GXW83_00410 [Streptacidiphilus sp. PB12-B1b]